VDVNLIGAGTIQVNSSVPDEYPYTKRIDKYTDVQLEAVAAPGYHFAYWSGDLEGSENPLEVNVRSGKTVIANFITDAKEFSSFDNMVNLVIPEGTNIFNGDSTPVDSVTFMANIVNPPLPDSSDFIGFSYELGPDGITFDQPVALSWSYDPIDIPEGALEADLYLAWYDENTGEWVALPSVVNSFYHTVTTSIEHATTFAAVAPITVLPASFDLGAPEVTPAEITAGEPVNISVILTNTGGAEGNYTVDFIINGAVEDTQEVTLVGGASETVIFTTTQEEAGTYTVDVNGLTADFTVNKVATNWFILGPVIAGVAALLTFVVLKVRKKQTPVDPSPASPS
jgi:hypothetical protein